MLRLLRTLRFRAWVLVLRARLRRLGGGLVVEAAGTPRMLGLPRVEIDGYPGTLTLRFGAEVKIGREWVIDLAPGKDGTIELGDRATLQNYVRFQPWGGAIRLAPAAQVRDLCELKSAGELRVGERSIVSRKTTLHCAQSLTLGRNVGLADGVLIIDSDHGFDGSDTFFMEQPIRSSPVLVGDNVFLAANVVVLRGTTIGECSVGAAGAVLNGGDFPARHIIGGMPARALRPLGSGQTAAGLPGS